MRDSSDPVLADLAEEMRSLFEQVRRERLAVFAIIIESNHMPSLCKLADYLEAEQHHHGSMVLH